MTGTERALPSTDLLYANCLQGLRPAALRRAVIFAVPDTWLDPLLSGPEAINVPASCPDIERLCNAIRMRLFDALRGVPHG